MTIGTVNVKPYMTFSNGILPRTMQCCQCALYDGHGELQQYEFQYILYYCQNQLCTCMSCDLHTVNGLCLGCFMEASHD